MTITLTLKDEQEARLQREAARAGVSLRDYVGRLVEQHLVQSAVHVTETESGLLRQIGAGLSEAEWSEYHALQAQRRAESLTLADQERLVALSDALEIANARRFGALAQLAELRGVTMDELMDTLDIRSPGYGRHSSGGCQPA